MKHKSILLLFLLLVVGQYTQAILVRFPNLTGVVGDTLTVPMYVDDDLATKGVLSFQFDIGYTSNNVKLLSVSNLSTISAGFNNLSVNTGKDYFTIAGAGITALTGKGVLLNLKFVLLASGSSLTFRNTNASNYFNEGLPLLTFTNGYISITAKPVITVNPTTTELNIGETQQFYASGGTAPYTWSVSDNTLATISSTGLLQVVKSGFVKVIATDSKGYKGESGNIEGKSFAVSIRDTTFYQNNFIDIPVELKNLDATAMYAGKFRISFTENVLAFDSLIVANSFLAGKATVEKSKQTGKLTVTFASSTAIANSGVIFKLRFKIADIAGGGSSLTFEEATINETLTPTTKNGYFSIKALPAITISPSSADMFAGELKQFTVSGGTAPYTWEVENSTLATTNAAGNLTAVSGGITKLKVRDVYGSKNFSTVNVYDTWVNVRDSAATLSQQTLTIPIDMGALPAGKGIISMSAKVTSSFAKIDSIKVETMGTLTESWQLVTNPTKTENNFALSGVTPITKAGKLALLKIYFNNTIKVGDAFFLYCNDLMLNEGSPNVKVDAGYITIKNVISGIKHVENKDIKIFPNPATNYFQLNGIIGNATISFVGIDGKLLMNKQIWNNELIPIQNLSKGIYTIKIKTVEGVSERKLIKN